MSDKTTLELVDGTPVCKIHGPRYEVYCTICSDSASAGDTTQVAQDEVEAAITELQGLFPDNDLTIDFASRPDGWRQVSVFRFAPPNLAGTIVVSQGTTLAEAMQKVREWKERP